MGSTCFFLIFKFEIPLLLDARATPLSPQETLSQEPPQAQIPEACVLCQAPLAASGSTLQIGCVSPRCRKPVRLIFFASSEYARRIMNRNISFLLLAITFDSTHLTL